MTSSRGKFVNLSIKHYQTSDDEDGRYFKVYDEALDFAMTERNVKNIGVTGEYGSGKSSIIHSYFENKKDDKGNKVYNVINISLSHFSSLIGNKLDSSESGGKNNYVDNLLEIKIVNQLVNQIDAKKIPKANLAKKEKSKWWITFSYALATVYVISYLSAVGVEQISEFFTEPSKIMNLFDSWKLIVFLCVSMYGLFLLFQAIQNGKIKSKLTLNYDESNLEMSEVDKTTYSYFDSFLDDVIYLFDESGVDVVVFEDLDRFPDHSIFEKLREINLLVNHRRKAKGKKKLAFIYVVGEGVFETNEDEAESSLNEKAKFFDFIIPVVPVLNSMNAYDYLCEMLAEDIQDDEFDNFYFKFPYLFLILEH